MWKQRSHAGTGNVNSTSSGNQVVNSGWNSVRLGRRREAAAGRRRREDKPKADSGCWHGWNQPKISGWAKVSWWAKAQGVAELVGTYMLVFFVCGSAFIVQRGSITFLGAAITGASAVTTIVYTIGHISGCHINPAVTVAFATVGLFPWNQVPLYILAQLLGSIFASVTLRMLFGANEAKLMLSLPVGPNPTSDLNVVAWEIIATFILLLVICGSALDTRAAKGLGGIAVGGAIFINVIMAGTISGCSMNPARSIGPALINNNFHKLWIYIISPVIGAVVGTSFYQFLQLSKESETINMEKEKSMEIP